MYYNICTFHECQIFVLTFHKRMENTLYAFDVHMVGNDQRSIINI